MTESMHKKYFYFVIFFILSLALNLGLTGCGFQLKESAAIPAGFGPVKVQGISDYSSLYKSVRNTLRQSSIQIAEDETASHTLVIQQVNNERRVLSVNSAGKVAEYELIKTLAFRVLDANGNEVIEEQRISSNQSYSVSSTDTLANNLEEEDISQRMEASLVDRMFRFIAVRL